MKKITFKTLSSVGFQIEVNENETFGQIKQKLVKEQQYSPDGLKLIFNGNILDDANLISSENLNDSNFIVVVGRKGGNTKKRKKKKFQKKLRFQKNK